MAPLQDHQVEKLVDEAFKHNNFQDLEKFLQKENKEENTIKCSRQFMTKLDKLFIREMGLGNVDNACLVLTVLHKYGEMLVFPSGGGVSVMVAQGFVKKMVQWFEKARKLWVEAGSSRNETMIKLAEDFFDALMVVHESCKEGSYEVTEALLSHIGKLASDAQINIMIQKEAARKLNAILEKIPMELKKKKKILSTQEASSMMNAVASQILKGGDYDLQVSLMEALCRMASLAQRNQLADSWFTMTFVSSAFKKIKDSEFETDCRKFLNMVNGMQGDGRSVYSYPCLEAFLDKHELLMPEDKNLEAFWIDFNLGSQSISFYFCMTNKKAQDGQWSTLCIVENEVQSYTVEEESGKKVLRLVLTEPACFDNLEGSRVTIKFSSSLDILRATESVYGQAKNRTSVRKSSIVKTPVHVNLSSQESSQVFVPESQVSPSLLVEGKGSSSVRHSIPCQPLTHPTPDTNNVPLQMVTPIKMKVSESCMYISGSVGSKQGSCSSICVLPSVSKLMVKPALQMMSSSERKKEIELRELMMCKTSSSVPSLSFQCENNQKKAHAIQAQSTPAAHNENQQKIQGIKAKGKKYHKHIPVDKVVQMVQADQEEYTFDNSIVPDSQPVRKGSSFSPAIWSLNSSKRRISVSGSLLALQKDCSKNCTISDGSSHPPPQRLSPAQCTSKALTQKQLHTQLTQRLEEVVREQQGPDGRTAQRGSSLEPRTAGQEKENMEKSVKSMPARPAQARRKSSAVQGYTSDHDNMAHAADGMVKMISSHYKSTAKAASHESEGPCNIGSTNRYLLNKSCCPSSTEKTAAKSLHKTQDKAKKEFQQLEDVYAFTEDTPKISVRKKSSDTSRVESSPTSNPQTLSKSAKRHRLTKAAKANEKKKLFSDTDTDNMTEISWLHSANRKPKPKVADYSRQPVKPIFPPADTAFKSPYTPLPSPKPVKEQIKPKRKRQKKMAEQKDKRQPSINNKKATGRPQRAAALTRTYRETSDSDNQSSLSESEKAPPPKKKAVGRAAALQQTVPARATEQGEKRGKTSVDIAKRQNEKNVQKKADKVFTKILGGQRNDKGKKMCSPEHLTVKKMTSEKGSAQGSVRRQKESWAARLSSTFASPPSVEMMRSGEKLMTNLRSNATPLRSLSISPIEADSSPLQPLGSLKASSLCKTPGNRAAVKLPYHTITPVSTTSRGSKQIPPAAQVELSPVHSLLTPTQPLEKSTQPSPRILPDLQGVQRGVMNKSSPASFERRSVISVTMSQSSHISVSNMALMCTELEKTPASQKGSKVERLEFKSGPTAIHKHLTLSQSASLSERDEDSEEDKENKAPSPSQLALKMKPRKLFVHTNKCFTTSPNIKPLVKDQSSSEEEEEDIVTENGRRKRSYQRGLNKRAKETTISTEEVETLSSCTRSSCRHASVEADIDLTQPAQQVGFICHQFSSELKRKIKNRCRTMDLYTRQTLKTLGQHMSSVSVQVHQYSTQRLEKVKQVLLSEIANLEQDDIVLRSMEEELTTYWEKQTLAFHTYQEKGTERLQQLKSTIQTDVCDSLEYEKQVFSVEMSLMKNSMKSVQEHFFKEIHEEELTSVRRGLQSLFFPDASRF
ncbi:synaptonemal complex protein 2-like isoform X2 [Onychostoma macrolepis]|uniref:synaptonemal complex protein 2-like isoform X2 n=1 Tax=Onychostoma macrolepis TaxID=369639 RepID=UPI00272D5957|nr:synaptonemal complex protein 2-like isoform X2 [Onychostoma macrolepis]